MSFFDTNNQPASLVLCTNATVWAQEFLASFPQLDADDLLPAAASWFEAAMETKRMMAIAALPLPPIGRPPTGERGWR